MSSVRDTRNRLWHWSVVGTGLGAGLLFVLVVALLVQAAADVVVITIVALLLAAALRPVVHGVRTRSDLPRGPIVLAIYVVFVIAAIMLSLLLVPAAVNQADDLFTRLPSFAEDARTWAQGLHPSVLGTTVERLIETVDRTLMRSGVTSPDPNAIVEIGLTAADVALAVLSVFTMAFFWLISRATIQRFLLALLPLSARGETRRAWNQIENRMGYWVRGQLALMTVVGTASTLAYLVLGLPNALLLGVFAGIVEIIPIVGPAIGVIPALITAFASGGVELFLLVGVVYVVIQVVEGNVLVPIVMKNAVGLPPFVVITSLLVGGAVAGIMGALLAVPIATAIGAILESAQARRYAVDMSTPDIKGPHDERPQDERPQDERPHDPPGTATRRTQDDAPETYASEHLADHVSS